jgi:hypothetical protein
VKKTVTQAVFGLVLVVGGAFLSKYVDPGAGALLAGFGGTVMGQLIQQPRWMRRDGAAPVKEMP